MYTMIVKSYVAPVNKKAVLLGGLLFMSLVDGGGIEPQHKDVKSYVATCAPPLPSDCTIVHPKKMHDK